MKKTVTPRTAPPVQGELSEAEVTRRVLARIKTMTPAEAFELAVSAGIYFPDGTITPEYGGPPAPRRGSRPRGKKR